MKSENKSNFGLPLFKPTWKPEGAERKNHESQRKIDITKTHVGQSLEYLGTAFNKSALLSNFLLVLIMSTNPLDRGHYTIKV